MEGWSDCPVLPERAHSEGARWEHAARVIQAIPPKRMGRLGGIAQERAVWPSSYEERKGSSRASGGSPPPSKTKNEEEKKGDAGLRERACLRILCSP